MAGSVSVNSLNPWDYGVNIGSRPLRELRAFLDFRRETVSGLSDDPAFLPWVWQHFNHLNLGLCQRGTLERVADLLTDVLRADHPYWVEEADLWHPYHLAEMLAAGIDVQEHIAEYQNDLRSKFAEVANLITSTLGRVGVAPGTNVSV